MIDQKLVQKAKELITSIEIRPSEIEKINLNQELETASKLKEAGFENLSTNLGRTLRERKSLLRDNEWVLNQKESGRIVLDTSKLNWNRDSGSWSIRSANYHFVPKLTQRLDFMGLGLAGAIIAIALLATSVFSVETGLMLLPLALLTIPIHMTLGERYFGSTLFMFPIKNYPFNVPGFVAETILDEKETYGHFDILTYANFKDVTDAMPKNIDLILVGRRRKSSNYGSILAMWGTDLEEIDTAFLSVDTSEVRTPEETQ